MLVVLEDDDRSLSRDAASIVAHAISTHSHVTLGLATGSTPMGLYRELVRLHREERLDFSRVVTFNLDEYLGLPPEHPHSYHTYMARHLFDHVNVRPEHIHIPDGSIRDSYDEYCKSYERDIDEAGGIDLQILGIGKEGHVGFNEAASGLHSRTRLKTLATQTREDNRRFFGPHEEVPACAITAIHHGSTARVSAPRHERLNAPITPGSANMAMANSAAISGTRRMAPEPHKNEQP